MKNTLVLKKEEIKIISKNGFIWNKNFDIPVDFHDQLPIVRKNVFPYTAFKLPKMKHSGVSFFIVGKNFSLQTIVGSGELSVTHRNLTSFTEKKPLVVTKESGEDYSKFTIIPKTETILIVGCEALAGDNAIQKISENSMVRIAPGIYVRK